MYIIQNNTFGIGIAKVDIFLDDLKGSYNIDGVQEKTIKKSHKDRYP